MSAAGSDSDAETVITEGTIEREKGSKEKETLGKVSQMTACSLQGLPAGYHRVINCPLGIRLESTFYKLACLCQRPTNVHLSFQLAKGSLSLR